MAFAFLFDPPNKTADKHESALRGTCPPFYWTDSSPNLSAANCAMTGNRAAGRSTPKAGLYREQSQRVIEAIW